MAGPQFFRKNLIDLSKSSVSITVTDAVATDDGADNIPARLEGVMLESTDWSGPLRDRPGNPLPSHHNQIARQIETTIEKVKATVFSFHGL